MKKFAVFDIARGQEQVIESGVYSGVRIPLRELVVKHKGEILKRLVAEYSLSWERKNMSYELEKDANGIYILAAADAR